MSPTELSWLPNVKEQERLLRFEKFDREDAFALGCKIAELAKKNYGRGVGIQIISDGMTTFRYMMQGSELFNTMIMRMKLNTSRELQMSSMRAVIEFEQGITPLWEKSEETFRLCGGCFPIRLKEGKIVGYALVSALKHDEDHQLLVDAISEFLGIKVPSLYD